MSSLLTTFGQNLNRIRQEKGLKPNDLSDLLGISEIDLQNIENGSTDVEAEFVCRAADILNVKLDRLLGSEASRNQLLDQIENKLDTCSEQDLIRVFEYLTNILKV